MGLSYFRVEIYWRSTYLFGGKFVFQNWLGLYQDGIMFENKI